MRIRDAVVGDAMGVATVRVRSWQAAYRGSIPDDYLDSLSIEENADRWGRAIANPHPGSELLVVDDDGIHGFAAIGDARDGDGGEVYAIYLHPDHWGRGWGRALMDAVVERLTALGHERSVLWVLVDNDRARRFYEAMGWVNTGIVKTDEAFGMRLTEVCYERRLP